VPIGPTPNPSYAELAEQQFVTVRQRLSERRRSIGMTMSELARQIGVSPSMIFVSAISFLLLQPKLGR